MNIEKPCNTTLRLGIEVKVTREKQLKQSKRELCLDLSLPIHPNIEGRDRDDHDPTLDDEKDDQDSYSSRITDDHEREEARRSAKRSDFSNNDVYLDNSGGSRKKLKLSTGQITLLEASFKIHSTLNTGQKQELAKKLHLLPRQIEVWFQNRRARTKLKHIEQECVFLRKCCAALSDENCRLKKELREAPRGSLKFDLMSSVSRSHHNIRHLSILDTKLQRRRVLHACDIIGKNLRTNAVNRIIVLKTSKCDGWKYNDFSYIIN